jgi:hypothetical protein
VPGRGNQDCRFPARFIAPQRAPHDPKVRYSSPAEARVALMQVKRGGADTFLAILR